MLSELYSDHLDDHRRVDGTFRRRRYSREMILVEQGRQCRCGAPIELGAGELAFQIHHIDHDPGNDDRSNLVALCGACHTAITNDARAGM